MQIEKQYFSLTSPQYDQGNQVLSYFSNSTKINSKPIFLADAINPYFAKICVSDSHTHTQTKARKVCTSLEETDDFDMSIVAAGSNNPEDSPCKLLQKEIIFTIY